jgi:GT2 family glycosyltransferase
MTVKVVILNWNGEAVLPRFLPSVVANTPPEVEIVVADNGSTDGSVELLRRDFPSVRVIGLDRNYGFAEGYNRSLKSLQEISTTDYYILLNSDVETPPGWCEPLIEMLDAHPDVGAVAPKILSWSERQSGRSTFEYAGASGGFIDSLGYPFCRGRILNTIESDNGQYNDARQVFWATGACFACRADAFHNPGELDGRFFAHQEEIDLCWRMQLAGWRVMVEPRSAVYHLGAGTLPPSPQKVYLNHRNNLAMLYKNLPPGRMQAIIAVRLILDALAAAVYLAKGEPRNFAAVWRAHRAFFRMRRGDKNNNGESLIASRRQIQSSRIASPKGIRRCPILISYLFGLRRFSQIKHQFK